MNESILSLIGQVFAPQEEQKSELRKAIEHIEQQEFRKEMGIALIEANPLPRRPRGRPTSITKEVLRDLRTAYLMGCTDNEACAYAGIHRSIFYAYKSKNLEFQDFVEQWKEHPILKAKATLLRSLDNPQDAQWYLERRKRDEFALRKELTGPDGGSIAVALDRIESNYDELADKANSELGRAIDGQVVEDDAPVQSEEQTGANSNV